MEYFAGRKVAIATMHRKEAVMAPLLKGLGLEAVVPEKLDTDSFGTFTREIKRAGDQLQAARAKAHAALALSGLDLAVASEGSFGSDPQIPFLQSNLELVLLVDTKNKLEIRGHHRSSETNMGGSYISSPAEAHEVAIKMGFPKHGVIVRKNESNNRHIYKNIVTSADLEACVEQLLKHPFARKVYIETDMRAHKNPTRMRNIARATEDLLQNIRRCCPQCGIPGFVVMDVRRGLPCALCGRPTEKPSHLVYGCFSCTFSQEQLVEKEVRAANPSECAHCNP